MMQKGEARPPTVDASAKGTAPDSAIAVQGAVADDVAGPTGFAFEIRKDDSILRTEPVLPSDLMELRSEAWWQAGPRHGDITLDEAGLTVSVQAIRRPTDETPGPASPLTACLGLTLSAGHGTVTASSGVLMSVARRGAAELVRTGVLAAADTFVYDFRADSSVIERSKLIDQQASGDGVVLGRNRDLRHENLSLASMLEASFACGDELTDEHHLFVTDSALRRAEEIARHGEREQPSVETGGVLLGFLGGCPDARDTFVVVTDALEARDAEQKEFSLSFSGKSWKRIQNVLRARNARPADAALRILGQMHGHPFQPTTGCSQCPLNAECKQHTAFLSEADRRWSRAVFSCQPWQLGIVFGIDPRSGPVSTTFGMRGGQLMARGYRSIADTDLARLRAASTQIQSRASARPDPNSSQPPGDHPAMSTESKGEPA